MSDVAWSFKRPDEPGHYYWAIDPEYGRVLVSIHKLGDSLWAYGDYWPEYLPFTRFEMWAGPIEPPAAPK
jgi:hypothetical protein